MVHVSAYTCVNISILFHNTSLSMTDLKVQQDNAAQKTDKYSIWPITYLITLIPNVALLPSTIPTYISQTGTWNAA